jgi:hypothetical protein
VYRLGFLDALVAPNATEPALSEVEGLLKASTLASFLAPI